METVMPDMETGQLFLTVRGTTVVLEYLRRPGPEAPLVCLHGFGGSKEDYADLALRDDFAGRELVLIDAPGFGQSKVADADAISIPFLAEVAIAACDSLGLDNFHLLGHSMGGLTALFLARRHPDRVLSFIDIEGNLAPEDCFLSRQIIDHPADDPMEFLDGFRTRVAERPEFSSRLYIAGLDAKVRPTSIRPLFISMVDLSDNQPLLDYLAELDCPVVFVHGEQNRHLSYLPRLPGIGVEVAEVSHSGHFPMYSNPTELWTVIAQFLERAERSGFSASR